ncbi:Uncharacterised protein [BD1-7 clade bacterium]|uniref:UPF0056 membrane protein n=1 Tax=BD1-7 clade bacterium TaxID=2029982 RepID=A0A5S9MQL8_9GAMM|nr:Uncharacterised protein [BD1-7 clade bacterium]CAA0084935.1 Uncharacterised protein [BD1-7 clade bacterium]
MLDWNEYIKLTLGLLAISSPFIAAAVYLGLSKTLNKTNRLKVIVATAITFSAILLTFTFMGEELLAFFGISITAFQVAGGILVFITALQMMTAAPEEHHDDESINNENKSPIALAVVPLTIPMLIGPGAISTVIIYTHAHPSLMHDLMMSAVIITVSLIVLLVLWTADRLSHVINDTATLLINRIMGLLLAALGVEFIFAGIVGHFAEWLPAA